MMFSGRKRVGIAALAVILATCTTVAFGNGHRGGGISKPQLQTPVESAVVARHRALDRLGAAPMILDSSSADRHRALGKLRTLGANSFPQKER
jgi:hypothetical protein